MSKEELFRKVETILVSQGRLIKIAKAKKVIFVGDTHGDLNASKKIIGQFLQPGNKIVFLGDYVDRGPKSRENLEFLLQKKVENPDKIFLLQGNHETHHVVRFFPADFWESLSSDEYQDYCQVTEKFPFVAIVEEIIALHGALPDVKNLEKMTSSSDRSDSAVFSCPNIHRGAKIKEIKLGSRQWQQITWGDFQPQPGGSLGIDPFTGRPLFGQDWFLRLMKRFGKKVLIRSHQPDAPRFMFDNRCLTIFASSAYKIERTITIADFTKPIKTAKDLEIKIV